jgi:phosphoglycolate phosphatase
MSRFQSAVFDLDGTLIDSAPDIHGAANAALAEHGLPQLTMAQTRGFIGHGAAVFFTRVRSTFGIDDTMQEPLMDTFLKRYETAVHLTHCYPGAVACLETLKDAGLVLGLCTNKPIRPTHAVLDHLDLTRFFDVVLGGDSLSVRKPDPAPLFHCIDALGGKSTLYVGDSEVDAETADRAKVPFALYVEGYRKTALEDLPHELAFDQFADLTRFATA